jgi:hypothetical protein
VGQYFMAFSDPDLEGSISHAFDHSSVNGDHIFFWNGLPLFVLIGLIN